MSNDSYQAVVAEQEDLLAAVKDSVEEFPVLAPYPPLLSGNLEGLKAAKARQVAFEASRVEATREFRLWLAASREVVSRVRHLMKSVLGRHDERLLLFGVEPLRSRTRRRKPGWGSKPALPATTTEGRPQ